MSWRKLLGLALLVAAVATGWLAWNRRDRGEPQATATERSDYVLRDFEMAMLGKDGTESVRLRAPQLQRNREDQSLAILQPLFLMPGEDGGWRLAADQGWVNADGSLARLEGNVKGDSAEGHPVPTTFRTDRLMPDAMKLGQIGDQVMGVPLGINSFAVLYDTVAFANTGLTPQQVAARLLEG